MRYILIIITVLFSISEVAFAQHFNVCDEGKTYIDSKCIDNKLLPEVKAIKLNEINLLNGKIKSIFDKLNNITTSVENDSFSSSNHNEIKSLSKNIIKYVNVKLDARKSMYAYIGDEYSNKDSSSCMSCRNKNNKHKNKSNRVRNNKHGHDNTKSTVIADTNTVNYNAKKEDAMNNNLREATARYNNTETDITTSKDNNSKQHNGCFHRGYTRVRDGIGLSVYKATFDLYSIFNKASISNLHMREISNKHSAELQLLNDNLVSSFTNYDLYYSNLSGAKVDQQNIDKYRTEYLAAIENSITFLVSTYKTEISKLSSENLEKVKSVRTNMFKNKFDRYNKRNKRTIQLIEKLTSE